VTKINWPEGKWFTTGTHEQLQELITASRGYPSGTSREISSIRCTGKYYVGWVSTEEEEVAGSRFRENRPDCRYIPISEVLGAEFPEPPTKLAVGQLWEALTTGFYDRTAGTIYEIEKVSPDSVTFVTLGGKWNPLKYLNRWRYRGMAADSPATEPEFRMIAGRKVSVGDVIRKFFSGGEKRCDFHVDNFNERGPAGTGGSSNYVWMDNHPSLWRVISKATPSQLQPEQVEKSADPKPNPNTWGIPAPKPDGFLRDAAGMMSYTPMDEQLIEKVRRGEREVEVDNN
jgi:hypothetical protein